MVDRTRVTVDVDERGRVTIPEPARRVLSIDDDRYTIDLTIRILSPGDLEGNTTTFEAVTDERGRLTIPSEARNELGIRSREATVEAEIEKKYDTDRGDT